MTTSTKRTLLVVVVWLLALVHQQQAVSGQCIRNLTEIALSEVFVTNTEFRRQYILCRNTMFEVGVLDQDGSIVDGYFPLAMKGNATVQCGRTGRRENNCLITFGDIGGLFSPFVADDVRPIDFGEATVRGITFDDLLVAPIFVNLAFGSLTFIDCAFLVSIYTIFQQTLAKHTHTHLCICFNGWAIVCVCVCVCAFVYVFSPSFFLFFVELGGTAQHSAFQHDRDSKPTSFEDVDKR